MGGVGAGVVACCGVRGSVTVPRCGADGGPGPVGWMLAWPRGVREGAAAESSPRVAAGAEFGAYARSLIQPGMTTLEVVEAVGKAIARDRTCDPDGTDVNTPREEAFAKMKAADDLTVELMLAEPLVAQPTHFSFDSRGRLWVSQYRQYPYPAGLKMIRRDHYYRSHYDR